MSENVSEVPVLDPLVEGGVFDVPAATNDLQCSPAADPARLFADDSETPRRRCFVGLGDHGADHTDLSLIGVERVDVIGVPKLDVLLLIRIVELVARPVPLP